MRPLEKYNVILASQSPRRLEILQNHGTNPIVIPTETDECYNPTYDISSIVQQLSTRKAEACLNILKEKINELSDLLAPKKPLLIIAADTLVYKGTSIMGKPKDASDAFRMLSTIRGDVHHVITGVCLIVASISPANTSPDALSPVITPSIIKDYQICFAEVTEVYCKKYSDKDIHNYIETEQPYDKAGAYAIQGSFKEYIDHISGDYENVVGLPYNRLISEIEELQLQQTKKERN